MSWELLDYYDKVQLIWRVETFIEQVKLHGTRQCISCKVKRRPRGFAFVKGARRRKAICKRCEARRRAVARNMDRKVRRIKIVHGKPEPKALHNPISYAPLLVKRLRS